jgi:hypothetical protein
MDTVAVPELVVPCSVAVMVMMVPLVNALAATARVTVATPLAVVAEAAERVPPVVVKSTVVPSATGVPSVFLTVAVMVNVPPAAVLMMGWETLTLTGDTRLTVTVLETVPVDAVTVTLPAVVVVRVVVAIPPVVVEEAAESVPVPLVTEKETAVPSATAVPALFFTVAVIVTEPPTTGEDEDAVTVTVAAELALVVGNQSTPQPAISIVHMAKRKATLCMTPP